MAVAVSAAIELDLARYLLPAQARVEVVADGRGQYELGWLARDLNIAKQVGERAAILGAVNNALGDHRGIPGRVRCPAQLAECGLDRGHYVFELLRHCQQAVDLASGRPCG